ncbi:MAG: DUF819 domain-containing protein [Bacteroidota bacterium]
MPDTSTALLTDPTGLFAFLVGLLGLIFWLSTLPALKKLFDVAPPVIWAYFIPMFATTVGITPADSPLYAWMVQYLLPFALFLLMITVDLPAILRLGKIALLMMVAGTVGIVIGAPIAYLAFGAFLPPDAWQGFAALSGSWIGGTANLLFIQQHVGADASVLGPIIVVDTVVGYGWMGILIFLSAFQARFDRWNRADMTAVEALNDRLLELDTERTPISTSDVSVIVGIAFVAAAAGVWIGQIMPVPSIGGIAIIGASTWAILLVVTVGLVLSFTPLRRLERAGASRIGYFALYLLLTSIGARANLAAVVDAPLFLAAGILWIGIHIAVLLIAARLLRAPLFFVATGSMANVGGAASAPIVAGVYLPAMAPVGLLMAVAGYILGIYAALGAAEMLRFLAG